MQYDYRQQVKSDILDYIKNNIDFKDFNDLDELEEYLNDTLWVEDSVTGNGSGSYDCNSYAAEEAICHNLDLLGEALDEFGGSCNILKDGAEAADVTIRCYLLSECIAESLEEIKEDFNKAHEEEKE